MEIFAIGISALLINNVVLTQFLGICPFLGVSKKADSALGMGMAVTFVITVATAITYLIYSFILDPLNIEYMQLIAFVLVIASLVQFLELAIKKISPKLYKALGVYLPLITTNCAVLGVAIDVVARKYNFGQAMIYALGISLGFTLVIYLFSAIRETLESRQTADALKGLPIALITAAIMAIAFTAFAGLV